MPHRQGKVKRKRGKTVRRGEKPGLTGREKKEKELKKEKRIPQI